MGVEGTLPTTEPERSHFARRKGEEQRFDKPVINVRESDSSRFAFPLDFEKPEGPRPANSSSPGSPVVSSPSRLSPTPDGPPPLAQPPLILQPLASPLQVGVPPMTLPIILNPALIEATSPVPLLATPRPTDPMPTSEVN